MHGTPAARAALTPRHKLAGEAGGWGVWPILPSPGHRWVRIPRWCLDLGMCVVMGMHAPAYFPVLVALTWPRTEPFDCGLSDGLWPHHLPGMAVTFPHLPHLYLCLLLSNILLISSPCVTAV